MESYYYGTFFTREAVDKVKKDLKKRGIKVVKIQRSKPVFAKDKFKYKVYTDVYV